MPDEKKDAPKRMMARKDFKVLRDMSKELMEKQKEMNKALEALCDKHADDNWWPDKLHVELGFVMVGDERKRIPLEERKAIQDLADEVDVLKVKMSDKSFRVAIAARVPVDQVNIQSGEIMASKVEECDPAEPEQPKGG